MMLIFVPASQQKSGSRADTDDKWAEYPRIHIVATEHLHTLQVISQYQCCAAK